MAATVDPPELWPGANADQHEHDPDQATRLRCLAEKDGGNEQGEDRVEGKQRRDQ